LIIPKQNLTVIDGWRNLHNLDLTAHHSLIESKQFQENEIPKRAGALAARLSKALATLFPQSSNDAGNAMFEAWGEPHDVSENRRFRLLGIFEKALKLKAETVTTDQQYEFIVFPPGTSHGENSTTSISSRQEAASNSHCQESPSAWLHASIHAYPAVSSTPRDKMADAVVQSMNFITKSEAEKAEGCLSTSYIIISKGETSTSQTYQHDEITIDITEEPKGDTRRPNIGDQHLESRHVVTSET